MTTTAEKIAVMQAFDEGKRIEYRSKTNALEIIWNWTSQPAWDWDKKDYRISFYQPKPKKHFNCYLAPNGQLCWHLDSVLINANWQWIHIPSEDKEIEL